MLFKYYSGTPVNNFICFFSYFSIFFYSACLYAPLLYGYINNTNNFDYQYDIILIDKNFINQLNDKLLLLNGLLVLDVVLFIQDKWRSINLEAKPLSLYYLRVGHNSFSSPTTKACFLLPYESYFFLIYRYFKWLKNDF